MYSLSIISDIGYKKLDIEKFNIDFLSKKFNLYILDITAISNQKFKSEISDHKNYINFDNKKDFEIKHNEECDLVYH